MSELYIPPKDVPVHLQLPLSLARKLLDWVDSVTEELYTTKQAINQSLEYSHYLEEHYPHPQSIPAYNDSYSRYRQDPQSILTDPTTPYRQSLAVLKYIMDHQPTKVRSLPTPAHRTLARLLEQRPPLPPTLLAYMPTQPQTESLINTNLELVKHVLNLPPEDIDMFLEIADNTGIPNHIPEIRQSDWIHPSLSTSPEESIILYSLLTHTLPPALRYAYWLEPDQHSSRYAVAVQQFSQEPNLTPNQLEIINILASAGNTPGINYLHQLQRTAIHE